MKSKTNPFRSTAISGTAVLFACFTLLNSGAQAQTYLWTGTAGGGDFQYSTGANWVDGIAAPFDWAPVPTFTSAVLPGNGTVNVPVPYIAGSVVVDGTATTDITFTGASLSLGKIGGTSDATIHLAAGGSNLTFNSPIGNAGWDGLLGFDVGAGRTLTINGGILGNTFGGGPATVVKTGTGTAVITSGTTNIGAMIINAGIVTYDNPTAAGGAGSITVNNTGSLNFSSGTAGATITNAISLTGDGAGNAALNVTTPGSSVSFSAITLTGGTLIRAVGNGAGINITNGITGTGELVFAGFSGGGAFKNTMVLSGASTFAGNLVIVPWYAATQVTLGGGDNRLPTTALVRVSGSTGQVGALDLNGSNQTIAGLTDAIGWGGLDAGARNVVNTSGTAVTLTLNTTADQSSGVTIGGNDIYGTAGNNLSLVKSGSATQTLSGVSHYTGTTAVNQGKLVVNGNISTSVTTVASGATLGGSGTVGAVIIDDGAFVTPGNSPGILTVNGNYTQAGTYNAELTGTTAGSQYDQIAVTGAVNISGGSLVALFAGSYALGDKLFILLNDDLDAITGTYSGFAQGATVATYGGFDWAITYLADSAGNTFIGGNDIALMAVPEPNVAALIGGFGAICLLRRRR